MVGFIRRRDADADWERAEIAYAELLGEAERQLKHIALLESWNDESQEAIRAWAKVDVASHSCVAVRCLGVALQSSSRFALRLSSLNKYRDALLLGSSEPAGGTLPRPAHLVDALLRKAVVGESPAARARSLATVLYYLLRLDDCPDHVVGALPTGEVSFSTADDLEVLLYAAEELHVGDEAARTHFRSILDAGFAQHSADSEGCVQARQNVERLAGWLLGVAPEVRRP
jgi:hypothetical protein